MIKKVSFFIIFPMVLAFIAFPSLPLYSAPKEVKAAVTLAAVVPSNVSASTSTLNLSVSQVLADASQSATVSIVAKDAASQPVAGANICIYSNRGSVDKITAVDDNGNAISQALWGVSVAKAEAQVIDGNTCSTGTTDSSGQAYFKVRSNVPGQAVFTIIADGLAKLGDLEVTFLPLPFPKYVSIGFEVPKFINSSGEIIIFKPANPAPGSVASTSELVNLGVRIVIPFWVVTLVAFFILLTPVLFIWILFLLGHLRRVSRKEELQVEKTAQIVEKEEQKIEAIAAKEGVADSSEPPSIEPPQ